MAYVQNQFNNTTYSTKVHGVGETRGAGDLIKRSIKLRDNWFNNAMIAPFTTLLKGKGKVETETNQKFEWLEMRPNKIQFLVKPFANNDTTLVVTNIDEDVKFLSVDSLLYVPSTHEQMIVTGVNGKNITVTRAYGTKRGTELDQEAKEGKADAKADDQTDAVKVINMSRSFPEGSTAPAGTTMIKTSAYNYSQIFRDSLNITRNDMKTPRWCDDSNGVGDKRKRRRQEVFKLHQQSIEHQLLFGSPKRDLSGENPRYITGGILHYIKTNIVSIDSSTEFGPHSIDDMMSKMCDYGATGDKIVIAGSGFINRLNQNIIKVFGLYTGSPTMKEHGVNIKKIMTEYGDVGIVYNWVLSSVNPNMAIFIDMDNIRIHEIQATTLDTNIEYDGYDGVKDTYLTDLGLEVSNEERHGILTLDWK